MSGLSLAVKDILRKHELRSEVFEAVPESADLWILYAQKVVLELEKGNIGRVAGTGSGKTVIALLSIIFSQKRTLFLVPNKSLPDHHLGLVEALSGNVVAKIITGETTESNREWDDEELAVFATGDVVISEISREELFLDQFDWLVIDEGHHAASEEYSFTKIKSMAEAKNMPTLVLTATPGNSVEQIIQVRQNTDLMDMKRIPLPEVKLLHSWIHVEETPAYSSLMHQKILSFIREQMEECIARFNDLLSQIPGTRPLVVDVSKTFGYSVMKAFTARVNAFGKASLLLKDPKIFPRLTSKIQEYAFWAHVYDLTLSESYGAIYQYYHYGTFAKKTTWYAKKIRREGNAQKLLAMANGLLHPKIEAMGKIALSYVRRDKYCLIFVNNKATALDAYKYLTKLGIESDCIWSGPGMTRTVTRAVLKKLKDRELRYLNTTNKLREGEDLSVDAVLHLGMPKYPIDMSQRNGRTGRRMTTGEVIYITAEHERPRLASVARRVKALERVDLNTGAMPVILKLARVYPGQLRLF